jgi:putative membrane protein
MEQIMYEWIKAFHLMAAISWMAVLLYLPRLYVYHAEAEAGSEKSKTFKTMERRLLRGIGNPAMSVTWILGLWMAFDANWFTEGWFHIKFLLVILMTGFHMMMAKWRKDFEADRNHRSGKYYRFMNEVPAVIMVGIVIMVVVRPF